MACLSPATVKHSKIAVVLGAAYGGVRPARMLAEGLPEDWTVLLVDRNDHMNHLYVLPRFAVLPGHEHKAFLPFTKVFHPHGEPPPHAAARHLFLHAQLLSMTQNTITLSRSFPDLGFPDSTIRFDYLIYALGSHLPAPIDLWGSDPEVNVARDEVAEVEELVDGVARLEVSGDVENQQAVVSKNGSRIPKQGTKKEAVEWMQSFQRRVERANSVLVVGGGALGIQYATDIADLFPTKTVTLLHSREQLLPRFDEFLHTETMKALERLGVTPILGERLDLSTTERQNIKFNPQGQRVVCTVTGREIAADLLLLCTGQRPNTGFLEPCFPSAIDPETGMARVRRTMQIAAVRPPSMPPTPLTAHYLPSFFSTAPPSPSPLSHISTTPTEPVIPTRLRSSTVSSTYSTTSSTDSESDPESESEDDEDAAALDSEIHGLSNELCCTHRAHPPPVSAADALYDACHPLRTLAPHVFVVGDAADAFGAIKAGHTAYYQGEVAARNILKLVVRAEERERAREGKDGEGETGWRRKWRGPRVRAEKEKEKLGRYVPGAPAIKVTLGLGQAVYQNAQDTATKEGEPNDLHVDAMWSSYGFKDPSDEEMKVL